MVGEPDQLMDTDILGPLPPPLSDEEEEEDDDDDDDEEGGGQQQQQWQPGLKLAI